MVSSEMLGQDGGGSIRKSIGSLQCRAWTWKNRTPETSSAYARRTLNASNTAEVETTATLSALKSRKALETSKAAKLLHLLLGMLMQTKHSREANILRLLGLLHTLEASHAVHLHALESGHLLLKAANGAARKLALKQHRKLLLLNLLLQHCLLMPLGLGHDGKLNLILLLLRIGRTHVVEAVSATTTTACMGSLGLLEESG